MAASAPHKKALFTIYLLWRMASRSASLRAGATTLVLLLAAGLVPLAAAPSSTLDPGLVAYQDTVSRYRSGDTGALLAIEAWSGEQLVATAARLWRIDERERASSGWTSTAITGA